MPQKTIFKNDSGEIHFGTGFPAGFSPGSKEDVSAALANLGDKKLWRCTVCNDLHIGQEPPKECPTCFVQDAYVEINAEEFNKLMEAV